MKTSTFFAPGRINLIGEHLDYNGGLVLPAAISLGITAHFTPRSDNKIRLQSATHSLQREIDLSDELNFDSKQEWTNYPAAIIHQLKQEGRDLPGFDVLYESTLPEGSGLSSSAAIEAVTAFALLSFIEGNIQRSWLAQLCRTAESEFVGMNCGIMDQFAVCNGRQDHALLLQCATLDHQYIPVLLGDYCLIIMNTNKPRSLIHSKYNERRKECEAALHHLQQWRPSLQHLSNAATSDLASIKDELLRKRARHVVTEQWRTTEAARALSLGDLHTFGRLLNASHSSLQNDYEVSGPELDALVEAAQEVNGCLGARMTGAGFGGCAIAIVRQNALTEFQQTVAGQYETATGLNASFYDCNIVDGVHQLTD